MKIKSFLFYFILVNLLLTDLDVGTQGWKSVHVESVSVKVIAKGV